MLGVMQTCSDRPRAPRRAIELARNGTGRVNPNPVVGAVIAVEGTSARRGLARGARRRPRRGQRDRRLRRRRPRAATLYVSLEPCCHHGPHAAVHRRDPRRRASAASSSAATTRPRRPPAAASGILRDEGVEIVVADGELARSARLLNQGFRKHARTGRPWVLFKSAMTLDGKVATRDGDSKWISGVESRELAHHWRASVDAVAIGIGTALADDPQLTARVENVHRQPRRVVFDSLARLPLSSQLVERRRPRCR